MTPDDHINAAADLLKAEKKREQINLLTKRYPEMSMDDAYAVQSAIYRAKLEQGRSVVGWKIGLTSKAMQYALDINIPDSGILFDDMVFANGAIVPKERFIQPRIEAEIAFVMKSAVGGEGVTREDVIEATDYVAPSLEILDTRILRVDPETNAKRKIFDTISDNAANAGIVLGSERHAADGIDLRWVGVIASSNGEVEETGLGAGVLDDPVSGIIWLVERLSKYNQKISPGEIILSGSFIRPIEARKGDKFYADFGDFGFVECNFN